ncbi:DUF411 domain-containing protein [Pseudoxanthomonas sp. NC8]|nr:DUF411 domain-containing protein [Pseudoxanthomonas sp. NC8]
MHRPGIPAATLAPAVAALVSACAPSPAPVALAEAQAAATPRVATHGASLPQVEVFKSPSCGCCSGWVDHLRQAGFPVRVHDTDALEPLRKQLGVPYAKGSCHTATVDGYVIEGHVPAADIQRLLAEHPNARGLVLPGMPAGSPGMEMPDGHVQPYTVERFGHDGSTQPWAVHGR